MISNPCETENGDDESYAEAVVGILIGVALGTIAAFAFEALSLIFK